MVKFELISCILMLLQFSNQTTGSFVRDNFTTQVIKGLGSINLSAMSLDKLFFNPEYHMTTVQIVQRHGYHGEVHHVTTEDGYILEIHRVNSKTIQPYKKHPIIMMHGILCASSDYVLAGPERGLAYLLADRGYDVWLANARGNKYSRSHKYLPLTSREYWDFSFHEIGVYDLPSIFDYVLEITHLEKVIYIAHSQGNAVFNVMASEVPHYQNKVKAVISLAPIGHLKYMKSPAFKALTYVTESINWLMEFFGEYSFRPTGTLMKYIKSIMCSPLLLTQHICSTAIFISCGYSEGQMDRELLPLLVNHLPAGASTKQFRHFAQVHLSGKFKKFDNGYEGNMLEYNSPVPPMYNLSNIRTDLHMFYSDNDWLATPEDTHILHSNLRSSKKYRVDNKEFNHLDFLWGLDVKSLVYEDIFRILSAYN